MSHIVNTDVAVVLFCMCSLSVTLSFAESIDLSGWQPLTESDVYEQVAHAYDHSAAHTY